MRIEWNKETVRERVKKVFTLEAILSRLIAAWVAFAITKIGIGGGFWQLEHAQDSSLSEMAWKVALIFLLYTVIAFVFGTRRMDSFLLLGGSTVCVLMWIGSYREEQSDFLVLLAIIAAYLFFVFYFLRENEDLLAKFHPGKKTVIIFAAVCGVACCTVIATVTCLRYLTFSTPNFDFGLFCNMFHYMRETGLPLATSERDGLLSHFAVHISPIYYVLLPFYYIFPSPLTLQIGQAVVVASGVIPVLLLARRFKLSGKMTMAFVFLYAFYPAVSLGCYHDLHENCFLAPLLLWVFYFFETEKYLPMYLLSLAVLGVKEDAAVYLVVFALYMILGRKKYVHGAAVGVGSLAYFVLALYLLNTYGDGAMITRFNNLIFNKEEGLLGAIKTVLINPGFLLTQLFTTATDTWDKILYLLQLLLPLGMLPFCTQKPSRWLLLAPMLLNLVTYYTYQYSIGYQYQFGITAFLIYAAMQNSAEMKASTRRNLTTVAVVACLCMYAFYALPNLVGNARIWQGYKDTYRQMDAILDKLPKDASVSASTSIVAHVADREEVYEIYYHGDKTDIDYVVFDTRYGVDATMRRQIQKYLSNGYELYAEHEGMLTILKKSE
ncbi:MAG: DUF2079 domain-containing protein [Clostridia bacterium]|nr:DUF2079 domain-containing protein [Clostridia bacterium]